MLVLEYTRRYGKEHLSFIKLEKPSYLLANIRRRINENYARQCAVEYKMRTISATEIVLYTKNTVLGGKG